MCEMLAHRVENASRRLSDIVRRRRDFTAVHRYICQLSCSVQSKEGTKRIEGEKNKR